MNLKILTPDSLVYEGEVTSVTVPGAAGSFQILRNHAPIISTLDSGVVKYVTADAENTVKIAGGVVEVLNNQISVLAEATDI